MEVRDYNGTGRWSAEAVAERYLGYCERFGIPLPFPLIAWTHTDGSSKWIDPIMEDVIARAERSDPAAIEIAVEFVEEVDYVPFRKSLKSRAARALRRAELTETQQERLRARIVDLLIAGMTPREFREYAKLMRGIGVGAWWPLLEAQMPRDNPWAMHYFNYLLSHRNTGT